MTNGEKVEGTTHDASMLFGAFIPMIRSLVCFTSLEEPLAYFNRRNSLPYGVNQV